MEGKENYELESYVSDLRSKHLLIPILHGDEGSAHFYDLYEVNDPKITCGGGCPNPAKFLFFEHWHTGENEISTMCDDHAPESYKESLNNRRAG